MGQIPAKLEDIESTVTFWRKTISQLWVTLLVCVPSGWYSIIYQFSSSPQFLNSSLLLQLLFFYMKKLVWFCQTKSLAHIFLGPAVVCSLSPLHLFKNFLCQYAPPKNKPNLSHCTLGKVFNIMMMIQSKIYFLALVWRKLVIPP